MFPLNDAIYIATCHITVALLGLPGRLALSIYWKHICLNTSSKNRIN